LFRFDFAVTVASFVGLILQLVGVTLSCVTVFPLLRVVRFVSADDWARISDNNHENSHIDMYTHTGSTFDNHVTLTFDLLISGSRHAKQLPCTVCLPVLVLIAQVVFLLKCGHSESQISLITLPTYLLPLAWVIK